MGLRQRIATFINPPVNAPAVVQFEEIRNTLSQTGRVVLSQALNDPHFHSLVPNPADRAPFIRSLSENADNLRRLREHLGVTESSGRPSFSTDDAHVSRRTTLLRTAANLTSNNQQALAYLVQNHLVDMTDFEHALHNSRTTLQRTVQLTATQLSVLLRQVSAGNISDLVTTQARPSYNETGTGRPIVDERIVVSQAAIDELNEYRNLHNFRTEVASYIAGLDEQGRAALQASELAARQGNVFRRAGRVLASPFVGFGRFVGRSFKRRPYISTIVLALAITHGDKLYSVGQRTYRWAFVNEHAEQIKKFSTDSAKRNAQITDDIQKALRENPKTTYHSFFFGEDADARSFKILHGMILEHGASRLRNPAILDGYMEGLFASGDRAALESRYLDVFEAAAGAKAAEGFDPMVEQRARGAVKTFPNSSAMDVMTRAAAPTKQGEVNYLQEFLTENPVLHHYLLKVVSALLESGIDPKTLGGDVNLLLSNFYLGAFSRQDFVAFSKEFDAAEAESAGVVNVRIKNLKDLMSLSTSDKAKDFVAAYNDYAPVEGDKPIIPIAVRFYVFKHLAAKEISQERLADVAKTVADFTAQLNPADVTDLQRKFTAGGDLMREPTLAKLGRLIDTPLGKTVPAKVETAEVVTPEKVQEMVAEALKRNFTTRNKDAKVTKDIQDIAESRLFKAAFPNPAEITHDALDAYLKETKAAAFLKSAGYKIKK